MCMKDCFNTADVVPCLFTELSSFSYFKEYLSNFLIQFFFFSKICLSGLNVFCVLEAAKFFSDINCLQFL